MSSQLANWAKFLAVGEKCKTSSLDLTCDVIGDLEVNNFDFLSMKVTGLANVF